MLLVLPKLPSILQRLGSFSSNETLFRYMVPITNKSLEVVDGVTQIPVTFTLLQGEVRTSYS